MVFSTSLKPAASAGDTPAFLERNSRQFHRVNIAFFAAGLATFAVLYCVQPIFPIYSEKFHVSPAVASLSLSVTTILLAVTLPIAGVLSDAIGRKSMMTASLGLSALCCLATALCPGFTSLLVVRAIQGITVAGLPAVAMAYLSEEVEPRSLGLAMGLYISGNSVGGLLGRVVVSVVTDFSSSWRIGVLSVALISLLAALFFYRNLPPSRHFHTQPSSLRNIFSLFSHQFRDPGLVCLFLIGALLMGGFVTLYNYIGFRLIVPPYNLSQSLVGFIFVVYLVGTFSSSWMGRLADTIGRHKVLLISIIIMGVGVCVTAVSHLAILILGIAVFTFGFFGAHSTASSWVGSRGQRGRGQASALYLLFYYGGSSIGGSLGGIFWSNFRWLGVVAMISGLLLLAMVLAVVLARISAARP